MGVPVDGESVDPRIGRGDLQRNDEGLSIGSAGGTSTMLRRRVGVPCGPPRAALGSCERRSEAHLRVLLTLAMVLTCGCGGPTPVPPERILLISIDTLRADRVGAYGAVRAHTPHLDGSAAQGVRFDVALSPVPLTLPAHASLMTGLDPPRHGVRHNGVHRLDASLPTLAEGLRDAGYATGAVVGSLVLQRRFGLARGFDAYDDRLEAGRVSGASGYVERPADLVVDAALSWLAGAPDRFFLWVHFYDPHAAYDPPAGFASAFAQRPYEGEIAFVDAEIGRLLAAIRERWGDTGLLVVATSDHGESLGEHGEATHGYTIYEATQRVPLLLSGPGLPAGRVAPGPASLSDVAPTLLALAGAAALPDTDGIDLRPSLEATASEDRSIYMETVATRLDFGWSPLLGLRSGRFKYVRAPRPELYDLSSDPGETRDRARAEPDVTARLDAELGRRLAVPPREATSVWLSPDDRARLRSLGYVVPEVSASAGELVRVGGADPKDEMGLLAELARARGDLDEGRAAEAFARLEALGDGSLSVVAHRAAAALAAGDSAAAERDARKAVVAEPGRTDARILLARALLAQQRHADADRELMELPPTAVLPPRLALRAAQAEAAAGRDDAALQRLADALERHPRAGALARASGGLLERSGRLEEALAVRETALALDPASVSAQNDVAWTLALLGRDLDRALGLARTAADRSGEAPDVLDTLATVLLARGEAAAALQVVDRALLLARDAGRAHLLDLRARALAAAGDARTRDAAPQAE